MKWNVLKSGAILMVLGTAAGGCGNGGNSGQPAAATEPAASMPVPQVANRGNFGSGSCDSGERVAVDSAAAYAIYADKDGNVLETAIAEDLTGTEGNTMCPTPALEDPDDPGACPTGYCARKIGGKTYCVRC